MGRRHHRPSLRLGAVTPVARPQPEKIRLARGAGVSPPCKKGTQAIGSLFLFYIFDILKEWFAEKLQTHNFLK